MNKKPIKICKIVNNLQKPFIRYFHKSKKLKSIKMYYIKVK